MEKPDVVAKAIMENAEEFKGEAITLKDAVMTMLKKYLKKIKEKTGVIPDETAFIKIVASIIYYSIKPYLPKIPFFGGIVKKVIRYILKVFDKYVLDRFFTKDWYKNLKELVLSNK